MTVVEPRIAIVGAGPAGIYAADILLGRVPNASIDLFEKLPAPYGLVRYGVAPDHPRIRKITDALHEVLVNPRIRLRCNVEIGVERRDRRAACGVRRGDRGDGGRPRRRPRHPRHRSARILRRGRFRRLVRRAP
ncbi:hypothetical protein [Microbacterium maritypicum]